MERYTVLSMNIGGYEIIHPIKEKSENARYIMVTDDLNLKDESGSWEIVYDESLTGTPWDRCIQVRYHPFKYTNDNVVIKIDGSAGINKSLDAIVERFNEGNYNISLTHHPTRNNLYDEYLAWEQIRGYEKKKRVKIISFLEAEENYRTNSEYGLCELWYQIQRNDRLNRKINDMTFGFLNYFGDDEPERVDQCIFSFVLQKYFPQIKIMWVNSFMHNGTFFNLYPHKSLTPYKEVKPTDITIPYWNEKEVEILEPKKFLNNGSN